MSTSTNLANQNQKINQNLDSNLSEAQIYYLGLFEKWSKPDSELRRVDEVLWGSIDFEVLIEYIKSWNEEVYLDEKSLFWLGKLFVIIKQTKEKIKLINLKFPNKSVIQINGDFYDIAPELVELYKANQLEIINCTLPLELENLVLRNELVVLQDTQTSKIGKLVWEQIIPVTPEFQNSKHLLHQYLAIFSDFVEKTEGKKTQLRITTYQNDIQIQVFSTNGATTELIQKKFEEFAKMSSVEEWSNAIKCITSFGKPLDNPLVEYAIATQKQTMDFVIKAQGQSNQTLENVFNNLINKIPQLKPNTISSLNNNSGQIQNGDNNTQTVTQTITNQAEFIDKLLDLSDVLFEARKQELTPKQSHYVEELEQDINKLKKQPKGKDSKDFLDKATKLTTLGGGLFALSEKILPILDQLKSFLPL